MINWFKSYRLISKLSKVKSEKEEEVITGDFTRLNEVEALTRLYSIEKIIIREYNTFFDEFCYRVKVIHGNKKLLIRRSILLHVCVLMEDEPVQMG